MTVIVNSPTKDPDFPGLPGWVPPLDTGQPSAEDLNDLSQYRRQVIAGQNTPIPILYGRDRIFGAIIVLHVDDTNGFLYVAYAFCKGEINSYETIYVDGVDINATGGFLSFAGAAVETHTGTTTQTASTLLSGALTNYTDAYAGLAYIVLKVPKDATSGFPRVEAIIQGKKLYDPRKDSTSSVYDATLGVSTHRIGDSSTWQYSTNPTLAFYDFARTYTDWTLTLADLDTNADYNDELINGVKRREIGLTLLTPTTSTNWAKAFRLYCGAFFAWENGELRVITEKADVTGQGAINFDGSAGTWVDVGDQAELDFTASNDFTVEIAFKMPLGSAGVTQTLVGKKATPQGADAGYSIHFNLLDQLVFQIHDGTTGRSYTDTTTDYFDDQWHVISMSVNQTSNELIAYHDGTALGSPVDISAVTGTLANAVSFRMGATSAGTDRLDGTIDEVRVWNDVRSATEISDNIDNEIADPTSDASLVGYWRLNALVGETAFDSSSSANNGTLAGNSTWALGNAQIIPEGVVRHFTADDILDRGFQLRKKPMRSFPTQVQVEYTDASGKGWPIARQRASAEGVEEGTSPKRISRISMPGIHNASQAKRLAIERLNWFLSDLECTLPVFDEGLEVQVGSVVAVTHPIGLDGKLFRVRRIIGRSGRWLLDCAEYDPQIYSDAVIADPTFPDTNLGDPLNPPTISGLTATEELFRTRDGSYSSRVRVSWTALNYPFLSNYRVVGLVDGVEVFEGFTQRNEIVTGAVEQLVVTTPVVYDVEVYVRSPFGESVAVFTDVTIQGKLAKPSNVPSLSATRIGADSVRLTWQTATDIDIWRYEIRQTTGAYTSGDVSWDAASGNVVELVDGLNYIVDGLDPAVNYLWMVKALDSVRNYSDEAAFTNLTLSAPTPVSTLTGFEIAGEVRLRWDQPIDPYVARYRISYDTYPTPTNEITLDVVDTLTFSTKDVPAGTYTFMVYARDNAGNETTTSADRVIEVTLDTDAFLADEYTFDQSTTADPGVVTNGSLTNMILYTLRTDTRQFWVTNDAVVFVSSPSSFSGHSTDALANYHSDGDLDASEWLSETYDFGLLLTGNWIFTHDVTALNGTVEVLMELSTDNSNWDVYTGGSAKGEYRYARIRISTFNPPGTDTAFVKSPTMNLKVNVVPLEENGSASSATSAPKTINLTREYTAVKEINVQPRDKTDALMGIVDNIIVGPNTAVQTDTTNYLDGGDIADLEFGSTQDFSVEFWAKHSGGTTAVATVMQKRTGTGAGWTIFTNETNENLSMTIDDGTNEVTATLVDALPNDGSWHHIAFTVDRTGDQIRGYVDAVEDTGSGSPFSISTVTGALSSGSTAFRIFANSSAGEHWNNGMIDEVRIWDDVRSGAEISANYLSELDMTTTQTNLIHYWQMNGSVSAAVTTIADRTPSVTATLTDTGAGGCTYIDPGAAGNTIQKINSFDAYVFDIFGQQLLETFQWNFKGV